MCGKELSFFEVYQDTFDAVWRFCRSRGVQGSDLEDVVQETYYRVHQKLADFEERSAVSTWVIGIALNVVREHFRRTPTTDATEPAEFDHFESRRPSPSDRLAIHEDAEFLFRILANLPEAHAEAFLLVELEGLTAVAASELLEINENTLRSRLRAARQVVSRAVEERGK